jgi:hypothetical protein
MRIYIPYLFIVFFLFLLFPPFFYHVPIKGMDSSYTIAICLALKYKLVFGKDFLFPFGPLSILDSRLPISVSMWVYLLSDLYFLGTIFFILRAVFKTNFGYLPVVYIFLCITIAPYDVPFQRYFYFFLFYLFATIKEPSKALNVVQAALLSILCFYYKVNLGITAMTLFLLAISYTVLWKKLSRTHYLVILSSYIAAILLSAWLLHVDLKGYIVGSWQLIDAYNDAMYLPASPEYLIFVKAAVLILTVVAGRALYLLVASIRRKEVLKNADELFIHGLICLAMFVFFKSGFVRIDGSHIFYFFKICGLLAAFLYLYNPSGFRRKMAALCCWGVLGIAIWAANTIPDNAQPYLSVLRGSFLSVKMKEIGNYCRGIKDYPAADGDKVELGPTVDVIPSEISKIYFNDWRYEPRPVIQSYSAYNSYLDSLNYQKYISPGAPDYVLFSLSSVDDRFPFFDESKTKLALFSHYTLVGAMGEDLLLRKKPAVENLIPVREGEWVEGRIGEDLNLAGGDEHYDLQYSKIFIRYNFRGWMRRLLYQPPPLHMTITLENGEQMTYRAIPTLLEDGMIINKYVETPQEFQLLMQSGGRWCANIKKIRFEQESGNKGFDPIIRMENTYYAFPGKPEAQRRTDSIGVAEIISNYNRYKPALTDSALFELDSFRCWVENIKTYSPLIRIQGWAFREKGDNENSIAGVVLRSGNKWYALSSENQKRPDLMSYFKRKDINAAGYTALVSKSQLPAGVYQIGLTLSDTVSRKKWIYFTGRRVQIQ